MKTVYGKTAYEGFAKAIGSLLGLQVTVQDGASACIDASGTVYLPGMNNYQTPDEFAVTCGVLVHELSHQFYKSHEQIDPKRSRLEHDCLNAVLDVADETWVSKYCELNGNDRPAQLLDLSNNHAFVNGRDALIDWKNASTHAWKVLCFGIFGARMNCRGRYVRKMFRYAAHHAALLGVDAKACWRLIKRARLTKRENPAPNRKRFRKLIKLAQQLADLLKPFASESQQSPVGGRRGDRDWREHEHGHGQRRQHERRRQRVARRSRRGRVQFAIPGGAASRAANRARRRWAHSLRWAEQWRIARAGASAAD
jgi:hypothetical protein